ncbi:hypothetical protein P7K49_000184, partial [Saguinus oedipus]
MPASWHYNKCQASLANVKLRVHQCGPQPWLITLSEAPAIPTRGLRALGDKGAFQLALCCDEPANSLPAGTERTLSNLAWGDTANSVKKRLQLTRASYRNKSEKGTGR